jgi:hypothetical protein
VEREQLNFIDFLREEIRALKAQFAVIASD